MALNYEDVKKEVTEAVCDYIGIEPEELELDKKLRFEYGVSSIEATELIMDMEDMYGLKIPVDEAVKILTTQQAIDYIMEHAK